MEFSKESVYINLLYINYKESYIRNYFLEGEKPFYIPPKQLLFYNTVNSNDLLKNPDFLAFASYYHHSACQVLSFCIGV